MDGVVIERTRPRLQTRITLWTLRLGSSGRGEPAGKYVSRDRRSGVSGGDVTSPVVRFRGPRGGVPRRMRNAMGMAMGPRRRVFRVRDRRWAMRWDFVERERHPHTCTTRAAGGARPRGHGAHTVTDHAHGAPGPHDRASPGWRVPTLRRMREAHSTLRSSSRTLSHRHDKPPRRRLRRRRPLEDYS